MEREKNKACFGFSWADEVEREEEEQRGVREEKPNRKPNPFGAARPRELVLEEKGVDWRKLDQDLDHHSNLRKDKKPTENISLTTPSISRKDVFPLGSRCAVREKPQTQNISPLVPPLRYPPKNIMAVMEQIRRGRTDISDPAPEKSHCVTTRARYNMNMEPIIPRETMDSKCKRKNFGERFFCTDEEMQANRSRKVLVDLNLERANFEKYKGGEEHNQQYVNNGFERRMNYVYGNQNLERTALRNYKDGEEYHREYSGDGIGWGDDYQIYNIERGSFGESSNSRGLRSAPEVTGYGGRGRKDSYNVAKEGVGARNSSKKKRGKLSAIQPGPCHPRRQGKQARK